MKFSIMDNTKPEPCARLRLEQSGDKVHVIAQVGDGSTKHEWYVLAFVDGVVRLCPGVKDASGAIKTDGNGQIIVEQVPRGSQPLAFYHSDSASDKGSNSGGGGSGGLMRSIAS